jgi:hypothetical protein
MPSRNLGDQGKQHLAPGGRRIVFRQCAEIHPGHVLDLAGGRDDAGAGAGGAEVEA